MSKETEEKGASRELPERWSAQQKTALENCGSDRIGMHVETDPCILVHGWIPPENALECQSHSCSSGRRQLRRPTYDNARVQPFPFSLMFDRSHA
jgi:hypothetical protein